ncbi:MAG: L,D-transpeptidase family protein [Candidatus Magasanikbacteria bacterium]
MFKKTSFFVFFCIFLGMLPANAADIDSDGDGLTDAEEVFYYTDAFNPDTDGDGFLDGLEVDYDYSPHAGPGIWMHENDYDGDGVNDWVERWFKTDLGHEDTDRDGISDVDEIMLGQSPISSATGTIFEKHIIVDLSKQRLYYYVDGIKLRNYPVSTGNPSTPTPPGEYNIIRMVEVARYVGDDYDLPNVKWNMMFKPSYFLHGAYWHNDFGRKTHSHGCVNMRTPDAGELYKYVDLGTVVSVTGTTPSRYWVGT